MGCAFRRSKFCWHVCCYVVGVNINRKESKMGDQIVLDEYDIEEANGVMPTLKHRV